MPPAFPFRIEFPAELPISARAEEIVAAIQIHPVLILAGETGSGKTTQIPKMCLAAGRGMSGRIACTQPRRVAALSISRRVAEELGVRWGHEVGCKIRFQDQTTRNTAIKFLTDGMLLAEVQADPMLREYDTIILDEAHERSLNIDFLLGHLRSLRHRRDDLRIIITSATIDTAAFSQAFDGAPVIQVEGRTFPVEVIYAPLDSFESDLDGSAAAEGAAAFASAKAEALHYIDGAVGAVGRILRDSSSGDILVFMPSERDIRETCDLLEGAMGGRKAGTSSAEIIPLFGRLSASEQQRVFAASGRRRIVVATNVAETSLTIPGIHFVVDTGLARLSRYSPQARTRRLPIEPIAQSSADQRKGRSGRVADGVCIRLYSERDFLERPRFTQPEIQRANLADVILRMKAFGLGDIERFPFINMPAAKSIRAGYSLLEELGALAPEPGAGIKEQGARSRGPANAHSDSVSFPIHPAPCTPLPSGLSPLGRELARLPVDPTVGRMILQARDEKAVREVLVIAAGLSIQDPRERPLDKQAQADAAHRRFTHRDSDFLTLLNIWDSTHGEFDTMSQTRLRRFCRDHFLSYTRMREWRDIHDSLREGIVAGAARSSEGGKKAAPLSSVLDGINPAAGARSDPLAFGQPAYRAIHRSILAGLLGNVAHLQEDGSYKATHDRKISLFPGSVLSIRPPKESPREAPKPAAKRRAPAWIMAAEIVETARLYARTCARLDPAWALDLGGHIVRVAHSEPFWDEDQGRVMVKQRTRLYGLEIESRAVSYGRIDPRHATEIFIREGLVNDTITWPFDFLAHNRKVRDAVEAVLTRTRDSGYQNLDEATYHFYAARLLPPEPNTQITKPKTVAEPSTFNLQLSTSSVAELVDLVRERRASEPRFLMLEPGDLRDPAALEQDTDAFPAEVPLDNRVLSLAYAYKPGQPDDGVTLDVGVNEAGSLTQAALDWAVPGHLEAKVEHMLRTLPKELRRAFMPLGETAKRVAVQVAQRDRLTGRRETLAEAVAGQLRERSRIAIEPAMLESKPLPDHLRVRVRVVDSSGREVCASRELDEVRAGLKAAHREASAAIATEDPESWKRARAKWEKPFQVGWTFGDIPGRICIGDQGGVPVYAYPGLRSGVEGVSLRLFKTPEEAMDAGRLGLSRLLELQLRHDLGWLVRDLRAMRRLGPLISTLAPLDQLVEHAAEAIRLWVTDPCRLKTAGHSNPSEPPSFTAAQFEGALRGSKADLQGLVPRFMDLLREILSARQELLVHPHPYPGFEQDIAALIPPDFLRVTPFVHLTHFPRYLKAMKLRMERRRANPAKDAERAARLAPYLKACGSGRILDPLVGQFRWLVEEFRVSLFAQELGTTEPVSPAKLDKVLEAIRSDSGNKSARKVADPGSSTPTTPVVRAASSALHSPGEKPAPLKNFGALDKLFRK